MGFPSRKVVNDEPETRGKRTVGIGVKAVLGEKRRRGGDQIPDDSTASMWKEKEDDEG